MSPTGPQKWGLSSGGRERSTQGPQASPGHLCILCLFPSHLGRPCSGTSGRANSLRQLPVLTPLSPQPDQGKEVVLSLQRHPRTSGRVACHERVGLLLRPSSSCVCCWTRVLFLSSCAASPLLRAFHDPLWSSLVRSTPLSKANWPGISCAPALPPPQVPVTSANLHPFSLLPTLLPALGRPLFSVI